MWLLMNLNHLQLTDNECQLMHTFSENDKDVRNWVTMWAPCRPQAEMTGIIQAVEKKLDTEF